MNVKRGIFFSVVFIFLGVVLSACGNDIDTNMSESMTDFSFTTQDEEILNLDDLKGEWWLSYMSYTECTTVCPLTTENMADIQKELKEEDLHPQIISFNVNPENDSPEDLRGYASEYDIDLDSWDFLTGYDFETIQDLSENTFHAALEQGAEGQISHSYMFYLINPDGEVVKEYNGMGESDLNTLVDDIKIALK